MEFTNYPILLTHVSNSSDPDNLPKKADDDGYNEISISGASRQSKINSITDSSSSSEGWRWRRGKGNNKVNQGQ